MSKLQYEEHYKNIVPSIYPQCLSNLGLNDVRDLYAYDCDGYTQFYVVDKSKGIFTLNHFVYSNGVADWCETIMKERGEKIPEKRYWQNVAIDYDTRKEANDAVIKSLELNKIEYE